VFPKIRHPSVNTKKFVDKRNKIHYGPVRPPAEKTTRMRGLLFTG